MATQLRSELPSSTSTVPTCRATLALDAVRDPHELPAQEREALLLVEDRHDERDRLGHERQAPGDQARTVIGGARLASTWRGAPGDRQARAALAESRAAHPPRKTISPWLGSYGDTAMVTRSPGITRMW